ncbi:MAG: M50 family metallopeptidase [Fimbriimonadaceae bacterium]|nr:M50 family metallopeptidase [Fimbriimonadaceae bacterium]
MRLRPDQSSLLAAGAVTFAIWAFPILRPLGLPLEFLNTLFHELCHAFATVLTGGGVAVIYVFADGGGVTQTYGGFGPAISSAGYVGTALIGSGLVAGSRTRDSAKQSIMSSGIILTAGCGIWLRGELVGLLAGLFWILLFFLAVRAKSGDWIRWVGQFLGLQLALSSVQAFSPLFAAVHMGQHNDALNMQEFTGIPGMFWASIWMLLALAGIGFGLWRAWGNAQPIRFNFRRSK